LVDTVAQINSVYDTLTTVDATDTDIAVWQAYQSDTGHDAGNIATVVDSDQVQGTGVTTMDYFWLTTGHYSSAATYDGQLGTVLSGGLSLDGLAAADVQSDVFGLTYNGGTDVNANDAITATVVTGLYEAAFGHAPTEQTLEGWLDAGLTMKTGFELFVGSETYQSYRLADDDSTLTGFAEAALAGSGGGPDAVHIVGAVTGVELASMIAHHAG
jgi:hypothetical protein